ncbi:hypothetical protein BGX34_011090, partial [Mortierella sp. NVP85]
ADLPWVFVSEVMGFYLVGTIYATPDSFLSQNPYSKGVAHAISTPTTQQKQQLEAATTITTTKKVI